MERVVVDGTRDETAAMLLRRGSIEGKEARGGECPEFT
jgi:hypothetical protein